MKLELCEPQLVAISWPRGPHIGFGVTPWLREPPRRLGTLPASRYEAWCCVHRWPWWWYRSPDVERRGTEHDLNGGCFLVSQWGCSMGICWGYKHHSLKVLMKVMFIPILMGFNKRSQEPTVWTSMVASSHFQGYTGYVYPISCTLI